MIRLTIDSVACELRWEDAAPELGGIYDLDALASPERARTGRSATLRLPSTPLNDALMWYAADACSSERFNAQHHEGVIECGGAELLRGAVHLLGVTAAGGAATYTVRITEGGGEWAEHAARTRIDATRSEYECTLSGAAIEGSWTDSSPVKFLPVHRDRYAAAYSSTSLYPPQRMMGAADYHPFISVAAVVRAALAESGYELCGGFASGDVFRSLYMSGRYPAVATSRLHSSMGFCAGRVSEAEAAADSLGRAYMSPLVLTHSLGNFVQTADAADAAGTELYNRGGVLTADGDGVRFTPLTAVTAGFEFRLKYTTDYRILSRERLEGFDSVYVDAGCDIRFRLANPFGDRRAAPVPGTEYMCIVFDHAEGAAYRLVCVSGAERTVLASWESRTAKVTVPPGAAGAVCELQVRGTGGGYAPYGGDWALYDGYVGETGRTGVDVTVQSPPGRITPSSPKSFVRMYLHGAREGQRVTLSGQCTLRPVFSAGAAEGSVLRLADIAGYAASQADLMAAVQQMFNLRFYTDVRRRRVYAEPLDGFFRDDVHDWGERVDTSQPTEMCDLAAGVHELRTLAYRADGGGAVARFESGSGCRLGEWSMRTPSRIALQGERRTVSGMFCATLNATGIHASAPSASVVQTGDRDADDDGDTAVRVVRYMGMRPLPGDERWGYPSYGRSYPLAAFHYAGAGAGEAVAAAADSADSAAAAAEPFTLCFEDRDGAAGLHRHYDTQWRVDGFRQSLKVTLALDPDELVALLDFESDGPNIRSLFRLYAGGQAALYRLRAVESYDTARRTARCVFFRAERDG